MLFNRTNFGLPNTGIYQREFRESDRYGRESAHPAAGFENPVLRTVSAGDGAVRFDRNDRVQLLGVQLTLSTGAGRVWDPNRHEDVRRHHRITSATAERLREQRLRSPCSCPAVYTGPKYLGLLRILRVKHPHRFADSLTREVCGPRLNSISLASEGEYASKTCPNARPSRIR